MRLIIAGTRTIHPTIQDIDILVTDFEAKFGEKVLTVVCGMAPGVDNAGLKWASKWNATVDKYPADWASLGKSAGPMRNRLMAQNADGLLLIWDGKSPGSRNMRDNAQSYGLKILEVVWGKDET